MTTHDAVPLVGATETLEELLDGYKRTEQNLCDWEHHGGATPLETLLARKDAARAALVARFEALQAEANAAAEWRRGWEQAWKNDTDRLQAALSASRADVDTDPGSSR